jgi:hypothetical protein
VVQDKVILQSLALPPGIMGKYKEPANTHLNFDMLHATGGGFSS